MLITFSKVQNFALVWSTVAHGISEPGPEWLCGNGWPMTTPVASVGWPSMAVAPTANTQVTHRHYHYQYNTVSFVIIYQLEPSSVSASSQAL